MDETDDVEMRRAVEEAEKDVRGGGFLARP